MRKLMVTTFVSLDGVMQAPGGPDEDREGGFEHGGWAAPHFDDRLLQLMAEVIGRAEALLLGRRTYDIFAASWPLTEPDDPFGAKLNGMRKYVASRHLESASWQNTTVLTGDLADAVRRLKQGDGGEIQVHGSSELIQTLLRHQLIDEFQVVVFPVVIGSGKRLFAEGTVPTGLDLLSTTTSGTGVVVQSYARGNGVAYGALGPETGNW
ncbi:dihydrofolate reductase family protein [Saccharomonospora sp. NPDC046836]|uniref:dihydrofolate reductase family protein n=1 Tax=Saccharomonospora sp. NPDC046836 TaxID=3156921 RepID=UPI0033F40523